MKTLAFKVVLTCLVLFLGTSLVAKVCPDDEETASTIIGGMLALEVLVGGIAMVVAIWAPK